MNRNRADVVTARFKDGAPEARVVIRFRYPKTRGQISRAPNPAHGAHAWGLPVVRGRVLDGERVCGAPLVVRARGVDFAGFGEIAGDLSQFEVQLL